MSLPWWVSEYITWWMLGIFVLLLIILVLLVRPRRKRSDDFLDTPQGKQFKETISKIDLSLDSSESKDRRE